MEEKKTIYANFASVQTSLYDMVIEFAMATPDPNNEPVKHDEVRVFMSPQHAKVLHIMLGSHVETYESMNGQIALPQEIVERLKANK